MCTFSHCVKTPGSELLISGLPQSGSLAPIFMHLICRAMFGAGHTSRVVTCLVPSYMETSLAVPP